MDKRRRVPRQRAGWNGSCHIDGELPDWRDCKIIDISMLGLGIQIHHARPSELAGRHVSVEIPPIGHSVDIRLEGEIRHIGEDTDGTVRVGIEFNDLSATERSVVELLTLSDATL